MTGLDAIFQAALERHTGRNFHELHESDKILVAIWGIEAEVNNGGFAQYYANEAGELAFDVPRALEAIGALRMAEITSRANALFGPAGPPRDWNERRAKFDALTARDEDPWNAATREFQDYPDNIGALLLTFIKSEAPRD